MKKEIKSWPWASHKNRAVETVLARMRIGHGETCDHLFRFNLSDRERCECGSADSVKHFLLHCPRYESARTEAYLRLTNLDVPMTLQNILGGGEFVEDEQRKIIEIVRRFLQDTRKFQNIRSPNWTWRRLIHNIQQWDLRRMVHGFFWPGPQKIDVERKYSLMHLSSAHKISNKFDMLHASFKQNDAWHEWPHTLQKTDAWHDALQCVGAYTLQARFKQLDAWHEWPHTLQKTDAWHIELL